ncbi:hypothetical protein GGR21_001692 [Dysgonomonas hofstadii]|uniref:Calcineurin-like phosphoesterase domain-containing protein n=1 Tax=Dysgonomonas hofstadii TaxID=637886 RepID=A0A840CID9_9BACT|nr:metallophosphoesterase [Dysgonomonas hofstadii]MBB4035797.1 hypothetical protein [Dysgonomonas hofstadii]
MSGKKKKYFVIFILSAILLPCICLVYGYYEARNIVLREMVFSDPDIPESFVGKKIVFISDIHCCKTFTEKDVARLVERINERNADIVIIGGDHTRKDTTYYNPFFREISKLKSKHGVFTVLGNHDHWENAGFIQQGLTDCGFNVCDNRSYWIKEGNDSIKIGGVGDYWEDDQLLNNTIDDVKSSDFCILLSHNPDYIEELETDKVDLMLSGHTHGGQITFFGLWAPVMPSTGHPEFPQTGQKYRYGSKEKDGVKLYVTSGIGMGGFRSVFLLRPR